jgi:uncharacterized membrane protein YdjX (TVP38/TMEM64 family)
LKLILALTTATVLAVALKFFNAGEHLRALLFWIDGLGGWSPLVFILIYVLACLLLLPGSPLTLGAGVLFGVARGTLTVSIASILGATAAFLCGRYFARDWAARAIKQSPKLEALDQAVFVEGWKIVGLLRLSPVFPFSLLNYALGLTSVSLRDFFFASWIGMLPGTLMYVYLGSVIADLGKLDPNRRSKSPLEWALYALGLVATVVVTTYVARLARRALGERIKT